MNLRNCPRTLHEFTTASSARVCDFVCAYRHDSCGVQLNPLLDQLGSGLGLDLGLGLGWVGLGLFTLVLRTLVDA